MQIPYLSRVMAEAPNMRLNAGIVLLALHSPLEVAEYFATMDLMSGGRMIFGAALGYREVEYKGFGVEKKEGVRRFTQNLEAIRRLWTEDKVSMTGDHFELMDATISTPLVQKPHPPIWIGANVDNAVKRAARLGDCWYINPHQKLETIRRQMDVYKAELDRLGKPFPAELPIRREVFCAPTYEEAQRIAGPYMKSMYDAYVAWGQDKAMAEGDRDISMAYEELARDRFIVGDPDTVAEEMVRYNREIGVNHIIMSVQGHAARPGVGYPCWRRRCFRRCRRRSKRRRPYSSQTFSVSGKPWITSSPSGSSGWMPARSSRLCTWRTCWVECQTVRSNISWSVVVPK